MHRRRSKVPQHTRDDAKIDGLWLKYHKIEYVPVRCTKAGEAGAKYRLKIQGENDNIIDLRDIDQKYLADQGIIYPPETVEALIN